MTQEEKQLLLKDLCARVAYGVKIRDNQSIREIKGIVGDRCYFNNNPRYDGDVRIEDIKPYLRPMSSMTDEEKIESGELYKKNTGMWSDLDWLNAHHLDYRGLIPMGLALEAPEDMYI